MYISSNWVDDKHSGTVSASSEIKKHDMAFFGINLLSMADDRWKEIELDLESVLKVCEGTENGLLFNVCQVHSHVFSLNIVLEFSTALNVIMGRRNQGTADYWQLRDFYEMRP